MLSFHSPPPPVAVTSSSPVPGDSPSSNSADTDSAAPASQVQVDIRFRKALLDRRRASMVERKPDVRRDLAAVERPPAPRLVNEAARCPEIHPLDAVRVLRRDRASGDHLVAVVVLAVVKERDFRGAAPDVDAQTDAAIEPHPVLVPRANPLRGNGRNTLVAKPLDERLNVRGHRADAESSRRCPTARSAAGPGCRGKSARPRPAPSTRHRRSLHPRRPRAARRPNHCRRAPACGRHPTTNRLPGPARIRPLISCPPATSKAPLAAT